MQRRLTRRILGWLAARLDVLPWSYATDPRTGSGTYWRLTTVLPLVVVGLVAGARSVAQLEDLTAMMSAAARRWLRVPRKLSDTTARDLLVRLRPEELRRILHAQIRSFHRQKALEPEGFRWGVLSLDGKSTPLRAWDGHYAQQQGARGMLRTLTASLVSSPGCPCIDAFPVLAATNEMGAYLPALRQLAATFGSLDLFRVVMYDAGACSQANARGTRELGLHYVMQLNEAQPTLFSEARCVLGREVEHLVELADQDGRVRYRVRITRELEGYLDWQHLRTVIHVRREGLSTAGAVCTVGDRYFVSSLAHDSLSPTDWARLIRARWGVENNNRVCSRRPGASLPGQKAISSMFPAIFEECVMKRTLVIGSAFAGLASCFPISFDVETSTTATMSVKLGDLSGSCSGVVDVGDEDSNATVTKTASGELCNITVDFEATAVDMADVRAKVEAEIREEDHDPADVKVTIKAPTDLAFHDIQVVGVAIPSTAWAINMDLEGTSVFDAKGDDLNTLVQSGQSVTLSDAQIAVVQAAYKESDTVTVKGKIVLSSVPVSYIEGLQKPSNATVDFKVTVDVTASGKTDAI